MVRDNRKKITIFLFMVACVAVSIAAHDPGEKQQGFKNLQVLPKDISKDSLEHVMHFFTRSLGVHCDFCHARSKDTTQRWPDFASDDKPEKNIARHMMKMASEINANYFNFMGSTMPDTIHVVTCVTCHHGEPHPENMPAMMAPPGQPGQPGQQPGNPPPPPQQPANNK
ncbi:MAG TPA: c-type cytochrome [Chitinophagaceae bacterium]|nr:c-type cytochrome [Chitinophagaceae bacterium]